MELTTKAEQKWDAEAIKDRLMLAIIGFSGLLTVAWCGILAALGWWAVGHVL